MWLPAASLGAICTTTDVNKATCMNICATTVIHKAACINICTDPCAIIRNPYFIVGDDESKSGNDRFSGLDVDVLTVCAHLCAHV